VSADLKGVLEPQCSTCTVTPERPILHCVTLADTSPGEGEGGSDEWFKEVDSGRISWRRGDEDSSEGLAAVEP